MAAGPDTEPEAGQGNASISPEAPTTKGRDASPEDARPSASGTDDSPCRDDRNRDPAGKAGGWTGRRLLRLCIRTLSLGLFIWFLCRTAFPLSVAELPVDSFLRLDPLVAVATSLAARQWIVALWPGLVLLILTLAAGRLFCGYICPLGVTLDVSRRVGGKKRPTGPATTRQEHKTFGPGADAAPRRAKFVFLALLLGAALAGYNLVFWGSPIPLVTRLYALLLHPTLMFAGKDAYVPPHPAFQAPVLPSLPPLHFLSRPFHSLLSLFFFFCSFFSLG